MKLFLYFSSIILFSAVCSFYAGQEIEPPKEKLFKVSASSHLFSAYVFDGTLVHNNPVLQSDLTLEHAGLYLNIWWSTDMDGNYSSSYGDEVDYTVGWSGSVWKLDIDASLAYYDNYKLGKAVGDGFGAKILVSNDFDLNEKHALRPFIRASYYFPLKNKDPQEGWSLVGGVAHVWKANEKLTLTSSASVIHDDGAFGQETGNIFVWNEKLEFTLTEHLTLDIGADYYKPLSKFNDDRSIVGDMWVFSLGAAYHF